MPALPTLFLDFDGVLHPNHAEPGQLFGRAPLLADALQGCDVAIVISSSWRFQWDLQDLRARLPIGLQAKVIEATGPAHIGRHARWHEISAYCTAHGISNWRALDDAFFEFPKDCQTLIVCEGGRGLQAAQCESLKRWLMKTPAARLNP